MEPRKFSGKTIDEAIKKVVQWTNVYLNDVKDIPLEMEREIKEFIYEN